MEPKKVKWTAIVMTCPSADWAQILQRELELRQAKGHIDPSVFLLTVEDPKVDVGSGGATINALLTVTEYISAQRGYTVMNESVLQDSYILILHNGRPYAYDTCGRPFTTLPAKYTTSEHDGLVCMVDALLSLITEQIAVKSGPGVWVSSMDMILTLPRGTDIPWVECDACAITVPSTPQYCRQHGVYKLDKEGFVEDIFYKETVRKMEICERIDGSLPIVCGLVYFSVGVSEKLLSFFTKPPLDACTYFGVDSGEPPIKLSLFFDVMLPMCKDVNSRDFRSGERSGTYGKSVAIGDLKTMRMARTILWNDLHKFKIKACMIEEGTCIYPHTVQEHKKHLQDRAMEDCFQPDTLTWNNITHSNIHTQSIDQSCIIINSILAEKVSIAAKSVVTHCNIKGDVLIGKESFISGLVVDGKTEGRVEFADSIIVQSNTIHIPLIDKSIRVITTHGRFDTVDMPMWKSTASFCNFPWLVFMNKTGVVKEDLWGSELETEDQTIYTARMFPVFHATQTVGLTEILWLQGTIDDTDDKDILARWRSSYRMSMKDIQLLTDLRVELESRRQLFYTVGQHDLVDALKQNKNVGFRRLYNTAVTEGYTDCLMNTLDTVCTESQSSLQAGVAARTLANIADVLGCMAGPKGGLRSGPAANVTWAKAFQCLEEGNIKDGVAALAQERAQWLDRPDKLIRAARHYEGAAQILIRQAVMTAVEFFKLEDDPIVPFGKWVLAECPSRIDVSGGWSDTPPITFEHGGAVTIVGLLLKRKRPVGAKTKRINDPQLKMVLHGTDEAKEVVCTELSDLRDYNQPHATGALLKAAFVCAGIVDLQSDHSLKDQLIDKYCGGFEIHTWTNLPHGSGMGTSSILAGAVMASILKAAGKSCDRKGLIHVVLYLEQMLTTGGGWQDQIGGLCGGVRLGLSQGKLPLFVEAKELSISKETIDAFNERIVLIYTGKTRLARNLLQEVVRNWYARNPQIVETEDNLVSLAHTCAQHFENGDLEAVGQCLDRYWEMKKVMAPGCETDFIAKLMGACRPHALGICMAGAGGGGFMYVLAKDGAAKETVIDIVSKLRLDVNGAEVYETCIDTEGMQVTVIDTEEPEDAEDEEEEDMQDYYNQPETLLEDNGLKPSDQQPTAEDSNKDSSAAGVVVVSDEKQENNEVGSKTVAEDLGETGGQQLTAEDSDIVSSDAGVVVVSDEKPENTSTEGEPKTVVENLGEAGESGAMVGAGEGGCIVQGVDQEMEKKIEQIVEAFEKESGAVVEEKTEMDEVD